MKQAISILILALLLLSAADPDGIAWAATRGLALLACPWWALRAPGPLPEALAFGFAMIAALGLPGLDWALFGLIFALHPWRLTSLASLALAAGLLGAATMAVPGQRLLPFANRNHYAVFVEMSIPLLLFCAERDRRPVLAAGAAILLVAAIAGGSRTGTILLLTLVIPLLWRWRNGRWRWTAPTLALAGFSLLFWASPSQRILDPLAGDHRLEIWQSALAMIGQRPWCGWGAGEFPLSYPAFALFDNGQFVNAAHSDWLEWAVELGIPFTVAILAAFSLWLEKNIHFYPSWGILMGAVHASVDFPFHVPGLLAFAVALAGSISAHGALIETESPNRQRRDP
ncbi:MAG: O-antigen ligase family protein [Bryobacter sp.]|jgi:O-antigen ligase|nr:O-antigen ligase family protein [Bryobacter sp. CoA8 C33]